MTNKATLLLVTILSYLIGLYLSPQLLQVNHLTKLVAPLLAAPNSDEDDDSGEKPIELPPLPPTISPGNIAVDSKNKAENAGKETRENHFYNPTEAYNSLLRINASSTDPFQNIKFVVHRNGEADSCASQRQSIDVSQAFIKSSKMFPKPISKYDKYDFDAVLTYTLAVGSSPGKVKDGIKPDGLLEDSGKECGPTWDDKEYYLDGHTATEIENPQDAANQDSEKLSISPFLKMCDMGPSRTPIQLDDKSLVALPSIKSLPCHFHTREGLRISSLTVLADIARQLQSDAEECSAVDKAEEGTCTNGGKELHLYAVPAGRVFIFAPKYIGEVFELPHVTFKDDLPVSLKVLSLTPKVFDIYNFFNRDESARIVDKALKETSDTHRMKRSSTGATGYNVNSQRTSENGFDTHGKEAQAVKKRCMDILGFDIYQESLTDGLQVLRYNKTTAYIPHLDWIDDYQKQQEHNFDSAGVGSNRFATILLYMSDLEEGDGGETLFANAWPSELKVEDRIPTATALTQLRESGDVASILKKGSWEEEMVAKCRTRLAVRPHSSRAVLFYSQHPDGSPDQASLHGGCPVISKEKWAGEFDHHISNY